jgi:3-dehydroquinate synthase
MATMTRTRAGTSGDAPATSAARNAAAGLASASEERCMLQRISVPFEYPVYFTRDLFDPNNPDLASALGRREPARRHRCFFVIEQRLAELWPGLAARTADYVAAHAASLELAADPQVVFGTEASKNDPGAPERLQRAFDLAKMDRQSVVVIVGGGALQDLVGYAAATAHRGLRVARVPTTVLAQADSGVGVKNGVNAFGKKNFLGCFAPPFAVFNDHEFLRTLPARDAVAGMAEAVKVALIKDAAFFAWLEQQAPALARLESDALATLIRRGAELHLEHIAHGGDPFELGSARPLDFGHWAAHKLESLSGYELPHGEAVAIGLALDTRYSFEVGRIDAATAERVHALLRALGLPLWHPALEREAELLAGLSEFREHLGGELTVTLLDAIGRGVEVHELDAARIDRCRRWLREQAR